MPCHFIICSKIFNIMSMARSIFLQTCKMQISIISNNNTPYQKNNMKIIELSFLLTVVWTNVHIEQQQWLVSIFVTYDCCHSDHWYIFCSFVLLYASFQRALLFVDFNSPVFWKLLKICLLLLLTIAITTALNFSLYVVSLALVSISFNNTVHFYNSMLLLGDQE